MSDRTYRQLKRRFGGARSMNDYLHELWTPETAPRAPDARALMRPDSRVGYLRFSSLPDANPGAIGIATHLGAYPDGGPGWTVSGAAWSAIQAGRLVSKANGSGLGQGSYNSISLDQIPDMIGCKLVWKAGTNPRGAAAMLVNPSNLNLLENVVHLDFTPTSWAISIIIGDLNGTGTYNGLKSGFYTTPQLEDSSTEYTHRLIHTAPDTVVYVDHEGKPHPCVNNLWTTYWGMRLDWETTLYTDLTATAEFTESFFTIP